MKAKGFISVAATLGIGVFLFAFLSQKESAKNPMPISADKVRELTGGLFVASMPHLSYDGQRLLFVSKRTANEPWQVYQMQIDGSHLKQVTQSSSDCTDPLYLPDGRIVFSSFSSSISGNRIDNDLHQNPRSLFTCSLDGSQLERITFFNSVDQALTILNDGRILFVRKLLGDGEELLMTVNPDGTGVQRFYESPETIKTIKTIKTSKTRRSGEAAKPQMPKILTSVVNKKKKTGWLLCLNAYLSQIPSVASLKSKPESLTLTLTKVRLLDAQDGQLLGEAPIELDGSFYLEVPANRLLKLQVVSEQNKVLAALESGIWVRPNETRGCVGCHEDPWLVPENVVPMAVQKPPVALGLRNDKEKFGE